MIQHPEFHPDAARAMAHFSRHPEYRPTPLIEIEPGSGARVLVKNESQRLGLTSFKALGAPYAIAQILLSEWKTITQTDGPQLVDPEFREFAREYSFVAASAGNHGVGLAAGAKAIGAQAKVYLSDQVPIEFEAMLQRMDAQVVRKGATYEDSVAAAVSDAEQTGAFLVADSSWPGYTLPPALVMEGYTVIAEELRHRFEITGEWPTHVFLQCGVGGLAAAIAYMVRSNWKKQPKIVVVEPESAACMKASHEAGRVTEVYGSYSTMGRLDCKVPSLLAWQTLERSQVEYVTISDEEGAEAAAKLSDLGVHTTSSGAAGFAGLLKSDPAIVSSQSSLPLIISTEATGAIDASA
ncbi:MAG: diaminopropionate ammonia-lyase [Myxococcota bacterium]